MLTNRYVEILLALTLLFHLQWFFGNLYEEILTPNQIVASVEQLNSYNKFFSITQPYYYYVPLTQIGTIMLLFLAFSRSIPQTEQKKLLRRAAFLSVLATALTVYIVTQYNLRMFFGEVNGFGEGIHRLYVKWAALNGVRIAIVGTTIWFLVKAYRGQVKTG